MELPTPQQPEFSKSNGREQLQFASEFTMLFGRHFARKEEIISDDKLFLKNFVERFSKLAESQVARDILEKRFELSEDVSPDILKGIFDDAAQLLEVWRQGDVVSLVQRQVEPLDDFVEWAVIEVEKLADIDDDFGNDAARTLRRANNQLSA